MKCLCWNGVRIARLFSGVVLMALGCMCVSPCRAAITLTDDVVPSPPVGDPWDVGGTLSVGETLSGTMTVDAGSDVMNTDGYVANLAGSSGTVTVDGVGSTWKNSGELRMGNFGTGTLNITGGGAVSVTGNARLGNVAGGKGTATVDGPGSTLTSDNLILVGREGDGTLDIQDGGVVSGLTGGIAIFEGSTGAVTIDGTGSAWNNSSELQVADGGTATLDIRAGAVATSPRGFLGVAPDGVGTVTVSGAGSAWNNSDQLQVGYEGTGVLNIDGGGTVTATFGYLGSLVGGSGTATVSGTGSSWTNFGALSVGYAGAGTLNIEQGGVVSATAVDGSGGVNFDGGTLRISAGDSASNTLTLDAGGGTLDVATAANVSVTSNIGGAGGLTKTGTGTLELTGANSYADSTRIEAGTLNIGQAYLNDLADVYLASGASLGLNFSGTDLIDSLYVGGLSKAVGTYGAVGSGADFELPSFSGAGLLEVTTVGVLGDYNDDDSVDAADYTVWRDRSGSVTSLPNDDTPGVDSGDYDRWKSNFGESAGAGGVVLEGGAVPEPAAMMLVVAAATGLYLRRQRSASPIG